MYDGYCHNREREPCENDAAKRRLRVSFHAARAFLNPQTPPSAPPDFLV